MGWYKWSGNKRFTICRESQQEITTSYLFAFFFFFLQTWASNSKQWQEKYAPLQKLWSVKTRICQTFFVKGQIVNISDHVGHVISVVVTQFYSI